jgi:uncharacterized Zn-finger protein
MSDDWLTHQKKEQELLNMSMKESIRQRDERMPVKWVYTKEFSCDGDGEHPRVYYKIEFNNEAICGYCNIKYKYQEADI